MQWMLRRAPTPVTALFTAGPRPGERGKHNACKHFPISGEVSPAEHMGSGAQMPSGSAVELQPSQNQDPQLSPCACTRRMASRTLLHFLLVQVVLVQIRPPGPTCPLSSIDRIKRRIGLPKRVVARTLWHARHRSGGASAAVGRHPLRSQLLLLLRSPCESLAWFRIFETSAILRDEPQRLCGTAAKL
jgi:hypothetical protein